jgi:hypothetical protein
MTMFRHVAFVAGGIIMLLPRGLCWSCRFWTFTFHGTFLMTRIQVFDPPMCCLTGVCGPQVDPQLPRFAADLQWLQKQGLEIERYNLTQQRQAFVQNAVVKQALVTYLVLRSRSIHSVRVLGNGMNSVLRFEPQPDEPDHGR